MASSDDDSDLEPEHTGPIPLEIIRAVQEGDKDLVEQWLVDTDAAYVNATLPITRVGRWLLGGESDGLRLLTLCIFCNGDYTGRYTTAQWRAMPESDYTVQMLAIARMLLEHGADANLEGRDLGGVYPLEYTWHYASRNALPWFDLLLEFGANPNVTVRVSEGVSPSESFNTTLLGKVIFTIRLTGSLPPEQFPGVVLALLRAGARVDSPHNDGTNPTWVLEQQRLGLAKWRRRLDLHWKQSDRRGRSHDLDPHFIELSNMITGVAAAGSFKKWLLRAHMDVLILRTQMQRGRAALPPLRRRPRGRDAKPRNALAFVLRYGDNGVVWNILSFWRDAG